MQEGRLHRVSHAAVWRVTVRLRRVLKAMVRRGPLLAVASVLVLLLAILAGNFELRLWRAAQVSDAPPADGPIIVCFGDSLTAGYGAPANQSYPAWLQRTINTAGYHYRVVNAGVSGERVRGGLVRLQRDVLDRQPAIVIVELGGNDVGHTPPQQWQADLETIVARIQAQHAAVILGGLNWPDAADVYQVVGSRLHVPVVWFTEGLRHRPWLRSDLSHANGAGYRVLAAAFWPALQPLLQRP